MAAKISQFHSPSRQPMHRNTPTQKIATCSSTNRRLVKYLARKRYNREIGLASTRSIDPLAMKSGKIVVVDIKASMTAAQASQNPTMNDEKMLRYNSREIGVSARTNSLSTCHRPK